MANSANFHCCSLLQDPIIPKMSNISQRVDNQVADSTSYHCGIDTDPESGRPAVEAAVTSYPVSLSSWRGKSKTETSGPTAQQTMAPSGPASVRV